MAELRTKSGVHLDAYRWDGDQRAFEAWFGEPCPVDFGEQISVPSGRQGHYLRVWLGSWILRNADRCWAIPDDLKHELFDLWSEPLHQGPCRCDCGAEKTVAGNTLRLGDARSCGCLIVDTQTKHGMYGTPTYGSWSRMIARCTNPKSNRYKYYGGRDIKVCERWMLFVNFYADMGMRPSTKHSIDRIDNDGDYEPRNCRWATAKEQSANKRHWGTCK